MKGQMEALLYGKGTDDVDGGNIHRISNMHMFNYMHEESIVMKIYKNEYGILVMIIGVLTAVVGGILAFLWLPRGGAVVGLIGAILGIFGLIIHFSTNAKSIFGGD